MSSWWVVIFIKKKKIFFAFVWLSFCEIISYCRTSIQAVSFFQLGSYFHCLGLNIPTEKNISIESQEGEILTKSISPLFDAVQNIDYKSQDKNGTYFEVERIDLDSTDKGDAEPIDPIEKIEDGQKAFDSVELCIPDKSTYVPEFIETDIASEVNLIRLNDSETTNENSSEYMQIGKHLVILQPIFFLFDLIRFRWGNAS